MTKYILLPLVFVMGMAVAEVGWAEELHDPIPRTLAVGRMGAAPVLDGDLSDWPVDAASIMLGADADAAPHPGKWAGAVDSSGEFRLAWDDDYLYFAADVVDDRLDQASATAAEPWQGDSDRIVL